MTEKPDRLKMEHRLDPDEQQIENEADSFHPVSDEMQLKMERILERARKCRMEPTDGNAQNKTV